MKRGAGAGNCCLALPLDALFGGFQVSFARPHYRPRMTLTASTAEAPSTLTVWPPM